MANQRRSQGGGGGRGEGRLDVCMVTKYEDRQGNEKSRWTRVGAGFPNRLGGFNVVADMPFVVVPGVSELILVPPKDRDDRGRQDEPQDEPQSDQGGAGTDDIPF